MVRDRDPVDELLVFEDLVRVEYLRENGFIRARRRLDYLHLFFVGRVGDVDLEHKPVELGLGQRISAFLLYRVLCCKYQKWGGYGVRLAADRYALFLHRLEERGLRLRRGPVYLVGQEDVAEYRAVDEPEESFVRELVPLQNFGAGDVGGHEVGRELNALGVEAEHAADETTHALIRKVNSTFVTPFDREDIYALGSGLDDVMDMMDEAVDLMLVYEVKVLPPELSTQVEVIQRCAELTAEAMPKLQSMQSLEEYWIEINRLENAGDKNHRRTLAKLFSGEYKTIEVLKLKDIVESLEDAVDAFEKVANTVEQIAVKES